MSSVVAVQIKDFGSRLFSSMYLSMASTSSSMLFKAPRVILCSVILAN